jgi:hypothetical protein
MESKIYIVIPRLPMISLEETKNFYMEMLDFKVVSLFKDEYLVIQKDEVEIHFFRMSDLNKVSNYGMCYIRVSNIDLLYKDISEKIRAASLGKLEEKSWGQREFSLLDNNGNLLTFGEQITTRIKAN